MATLTDISIATRRIIRYGIYAIIIIVIARYAFGFGKNIYKMLFPPKPVPPSVAFGKLPAMPFPERPESTFNYTLELPEGSLPVFPDQIEVYAAMPEPETNIDVLDMAKGKARNLGFNPNGKLLFDTLPNVYIFSKNEVPSNLTMNIVTNLFSISYNINEDASIFNGMPPDANSAIGQAKNFLSSGGFLTDDLKNGTATHSYLKMDSGEFKPAISLSEANATKINLFRKPYGKEGNIPPVTPEMPESNVWFIISGGHGKQIIACEYHYFALNAGKFATYPVKTSETAWEELKAGNAFIANVGNNPDGNITVRKVYLAYYDPGQYAEYYLPVVVYEGDNNFFAYVPAVTSEYYPK